MEAIRVHAGNTSWIMPQPQTAPEPPESYLSMQNTAVAPFYTVDYAELTDGTWTIIEAGDGQVSGLAESDDPIRFYKAMASCLAQFDTDCAPLARDVNC